MSQRQLRILYLTVYNTLFACFWATILLKVIHHAPNGKANLFLATSALTRWVQTASFLEVVHAALGLVKSPVSTTALQIVVRIIQVWVIWNGFPDTTASSHAYQALLLAWSIADTIRYSYLALHLHRKAPYPLTWLRYTMFYPLYPIGIGAEWWLLYRAIPSARQLNPLIPLVFYACLVMYGPGAYTMYTHMMRQRRKTLGQRPT